MPTIRRRVPTYEPRTTIRSVRFSADEYTDVREAAVRMRMTPSGYVAAAALAAARPCDAAATLESRERLDELRATRAQLARIGNNLNQVARALNAGGDVSELDAVLRLVGRVAARADAAMRDLLPDRARPRRGP